MGLMSGLTADWRDRPRPVRTKSLRQYATGAKMAVVKYSKRRHPVTSTPLPRLAALLAALVAAVPAAAQTLGSVDSLSAQHSTRTTLDPYPPETGWKDLAELLDKLKPGVDTRLDPTPSQITSYIESRINAGDLDEALRVTEAREAALKDKPGTDVQLMFQHARVLAALGRTQEAIDLYTEMTTRFPELPEPWNNLAALQAGRGDIAAARETLSMALQANPDYADARANLDALASLDQPGAGNGAPASPPKKETPQQ